MKPNGRFTPCAPQVVRDRDLPGNVARRRKESEAEARRKASLASLEAARIALANGITLGEAGVVSRPRTLTVAEVEARVASPQYPTAVRVAPSLDEVLRKKAKDLTSEDLAILDAATKGGA